MDQDNHTSIERWNSWILQFAENFLGEEKLETLRIALACFSIL
jgi:hypothetical protein